MDKVNYDGVVFHVFKPIELPEYISNIAEGIVLYPKILAYAAAKFFILSANAYDIAAQHLFKLFSPRTSLGDRITHFALGVLELIPLVNMIAAYVEKRYQYSSVYDVIENMLGGIEPPKFTGSVHFPNQGTDRAEGLVTAPIMKGPNNEYYLVQLPHGPNLKHKYGIYFQKGLMVDNFAYAERYGGGSGRSPMSERIELDEEDFNIFDKDSHAGLRQAVRNFAAHPNAPFEALDLPQEK